MVAKKETKTEETTEKFYETGVVALDLQLGGYLPKGKLIELNGESGCGKTTLMLHVTKSIIRQGGRVAYFDIEKGIDDTMLQTMGIPPESVGNSFILDNETSLYSELQERIDALLGKDPKDRTKPAVRNENTPDLIVIDSLAVLVADGSKEKNIEANVNNNMITAKYQTQLIKDLIGDISSTGATVVFINHTVLKMQKVGFSMFIPKQDSAGGAMVKYGPDIRFYMDGTKEIKKERKTAIGVQEARIGATADIWTKKSRLIDNGIKLPIKIIDARGVFNGYTLLPMCMTQGWITTLGGGWYTVGKPLVDKEEKIQTSDKVEVWCQKNAELIINTLKDKGFYRLTFDRPLEVTMSDIVLSPNTKKK